MRLAVTCAALIVLALDLSLGQEEEKAPGVPWVARMEFGGYQLLTAPQDSPSPEAYQINMLHGITAQPWTLVLLHAAWRYRETLAPGFTKPFREPLGWQGSGTVALIPDFFFVWGAVNWPMGNSTSPLVDSNAWSAFLSEHATLPDLSIASSPTVQVGAMIRIQSDPSVFLLGMSYQRAASFAGLESNRFRPPWILGLKLRSDLPLWEDRQRIESIRSRGNG
jgi:hypothetical protein